MKIIKPSVTIYKPETEKDILAKLEFCGRVCYKSEDKITENSSASFIKGIIERGHEAVLEHASITVKFICDRGVTHEIVRHRVASYCQESTRYCNYSKEKFGNEITVIEPFDLKWDEFQIWKSSCESSEKAYFEMLRCGATPQQARSVLPNSLKTELVMTADIREWRHFLKLRTSNAAHPQMREVAMMLLSELKGRYPTLFFDID